MEVLPASPQAMTRALAILRQGGVVAHATETCYGLACDLTDPRAVEKLFAIKRRPSDLPVSALFASVSEAKKYVQWNDEAEQLARQYLPGPLTLILPRRQTAQQLFIVPATSYELQATSSLGIRVSSHPVASALARRFGSPLSTTSTNLHGRPNAYDVAGILAQFKDRKMQPDLVIDSGTLPSVPPSTVVDVSQSGPQRTKRQGEVRA